jgi:hypothetical protein
MGRIASGLILGTLTRSRPPKIKGYDIELAWQRKLYMMSYSFLHWPAADIRWLYPEIHDWDWSEPDQDYTIPAYISFLLNVTQDMPYDSKRKFEAHIRDVTGIRYEFKWEWNDGLVWAIRRHINYRYNYYYPQNVETPVFEVSRWYSTLEWEAQQKRWGLGNGHNDRDVLLVPR